MSIDDLDVVAISAADLGRLVKRSAVADLGRLLRGPRRSELLEGLIQRMSGVFVAQRAGSLRAVVHWRIDGRLGGGADTYELVIADGACQVSPTADRRPDLTLGISDIDFLKLVSGNAHPVAMVIRGKLRTKGDLVLAARFPNLFDVPTA
jgi:hypothetical protein